MILGVYWYFGFPEGLYAYDYFEFSRGYGGHADNPAELITEVEVGNAGGLIDDLKALVNQYSDAFVFIYKSDSFLKIGTGGYGMHDYDFELMVMVEQLLKRRKAKKIVLDHKLDMELIRLYNENLVQPGRLSKKYFSLASCALKKYNAETATIRFDCNVGVNRKDEFLKALHILTEKAFIDVVFYHESIVGTRHNLMLFFTSGRQGVGMQAKRYVDIEILENGMDDLIATFGIELKFVGGFENYPKSKAIVVKIVDEEFILD